MPDFECPDCGGGFPRTSHRGECPWCGEDMAGDHSRIGAPIGTVSTTTTAGSRIEHVGGTTRPLSEEIDTTTSEFRFGGDGR